MLVFVIPGRNSPSALPFSQNLFPKMKQFLGGTNFSMNGNENIGWGASLSNDVVILQNIGIFKRFKTRQGNLSYLLSGRVYFSNWLRTMGDRDAWQTASSVPQFPLFIFKQLRRHRLIRSGMDCASKTMSSFEGLPLYHKGEVAWTKRGAVVASLERTDATTYGKFQTTSKYY